MLLAAKACARDRSRLAVPPVENATRTAEHLARLEQRSADLRTRLANLLPIGTPFVWEIGCGHGHFLTAYANAHPDQFCVGIDLIGDRIDRGTRKRDRAKLANLHFIQAEAEAFLANLPPEARLSSVYVLFSDPWPKRRHHKNRVMQPEFLEKIARRTSPDSRLYFRTDYEPYYQDTGAMIREHMRWTQVEEPWPFEHETVFQSRSESYHSLIARPKIVSNIVL